MSRYKKLIIWGFVVPYILFSQITKVQAKMLPRYKNAPAAARPAGSSIYVAPSLRTDRRALNVYFSNLSKANVVTYTLIYQTNGEDRGVSGTINLTGSDSITRELLFGTESAGVYRFDENISNMKLEILSELKTGKRTLKRFKIRV